MGKNKIICYVGFGLIAIMFSVLVLLMDDLMSIFAITSSEIVRVMIAIFIFHIGLKWIEWAVPIFISLWEKDK